MCEVYVPSLFIDFLKDYSNNKFENFYPLFPRISGHELNGGELAGVFIAKKQMDIYRMQTIVYGMIIGSVGSESSVSVEEGYFENAYEFAHEKGFTIVPFHTHTQKGLKGFSEQDRRVFHSLRNATSRDLVSMLITPNDVLCLPENAAFVNVENLDGIWKSSMKNVSTLFKEQPFGLVVDYDFLKEFYISI